VFEALTSFVIVVDSFNLFMNGIKEPTAIMNRLKESTTITNEVRASITIINEVKGSTAMKKRNQQRSWTK
jgi:hypothetical protein